MTGDLETEAGRTAFKRWYESHVREIDLVLDLSLKDTRFDIENDVRIRLGWRALMALRKVFGKDIILEVY